MIEIRGISFASNTSTGKVGVLKSNGPIDAPLEARQCDFYENGDVRLKTQIQINEEWKIDDAFLPRLFGIICVEDTTGGLGRHSRFLLQSISGMVPSGPSGPSASTGAAASVVQDLDDDADDADDDKVQIFVVFTLNSPSLPLLIDFCEDGANKMRLIQETISAPTANGGDEAGGGDGEGENGEGGGGPDEQGGEASEQEAPDEAPGFDCIAKGILLDASMLQSIIVRLAMRGIACVAIDPDGTPLGTFESYLSEKMTRLYASLPSKGDFAERVPARNVSKWGALHLDDKRFYTPESIGRHVAMTSTPQEIAELPLPLRAFAEKQAEFAAWKKGEGMGPFENPKKCAPGLVENLSFDAQAALLTAFFIKRFCTAEDCGAWRGQSVWQDKDFLFERCEVLMRFFGMHGHMARCIGSYVRSNAHRGYGKILRRFVADTSGVRLAAASVARCVFDKENGEWLAGGRTGKKRKRRA